jgi:hypothetical protein
VQGATVRYAPSFLNLTRRNSNDAADGLASATIATNVRGQHWEGVGGRRGPLPHRTSSTSSLDGCHSSGGWVAVGAGAHRG